MGDTNVTTAGAMGVPLQSRPTHDVTHQRGVAPIKRKLFWLFLVRCGPIFLLAFAGSFFIQFYFAKSHSISVHSGLYKDLAGLFAVELAFAIAGSFAAAALISSWAQRLIPDETIPLAPATTLPP